MGFYLWLIQQPVFKRESKAINDAHSLLNDIAIATFANDGNPVALGYKKIQDRFRKYAQSHVDFLKALQKLNLLEITLRGHCREFHLPTDRAWIALADGNHRWLHLLKTDPKIRRRNQIAIAGRKRRRKIYADPTLRIIDEFRHGVKFERAGLLRQLRIDGNSISNSSWAYTAAGFKSRGVGIAGPRIRHAEVLPLLLAFEEQNFCELILKDGKIYHEFEDIPWNYRRFTFFTGKPYVGFWAIKEFQPHFVGSLPPELFPAIFDFGEKLGWALVYENDGVGVFADRNKKNSSSKLEKLKAFIQEQLAEKSSA